MVSLNPTPTKAAPPDQVASPKFSHSSDCMSALLNGESYNPEGLCCTNPVRDSFRESSVIAGLHEQTYTPKLQDQELAGL